MPDEQAEIDARILDYYGELFDESARLTTRSPQGPLEQQRTLEVVLRHLSGRRVVDIGGGPGRHARALLDLGVDVELVDPVPRHIEEARSRGISARLGDARALPFEDDAFDAALLLGPLYHLADQEDRVLALREASRVTRSGGVVFGASISRFIAFASLFLESQPAPVAAEVVRVLDDGTPPLGLRFPAGHFHSAFELRAELELAGLEVREVLGVEGPAGLLLETSTDATPEVAAAALTLARAAADRPDLADLSAHLLAVGAVHKSDGVGAHLG